MEEILSSLSVDELDRLMGVMNRDKQLRERERERVTRLGVELVKEKRLGALVVRNQQKVNAESRCARCMKTLPAVARLNKSKWRCRVCNHLVCKSCRVLRRKEVVHRDSTLSKVEPIFDPWSTLRNASAATNQLEPDEQQDADVSSLSSRTESSASLNEFMAASQMHDVRRKLEIFSTKSENDGSGSESYNNVESEELKELSFESTTVDKLSGTHHEPTEDHVDQYTCGTISCNVKDGECDVTATNQKYVDKKTDQSSEKVTNSVCDIMKNTSASNSNHKMEYRESSSENPLRGDREVMARFLKMAGVEIQPNTVTGTKQHLQEVAPALQKLTLEEKIFTSTPVKTLTMLSRSPLQIASKLFVHKPRDNNSLSIVDKKSFLDVGLVEIFQNSKPDFKLSSLSDSNGLVDYPKAVAEQQKLKVEEKPTEEDGDANISRKQLPASQSSSSSNSCAPQSMVNSSKNRNLHITLELLKFSKRLGLSPYKLHFAPGYNTSTPDFNDSDDASNDGSVCDIETDTSISISYLQLLSKHNSKPFVRLKASKVTRERQKARKQRRLQKLKAKRSFVSDYLQHSDFSDEEVEDQGLRTIWDNNRNDLGEREPDGPDTLLLQPLSQEDNFDSKSLVVRGLTATSMMLTSVGDMTKKLLRQNKIFWVCRVCHKTIDLHKKTGNWFHKATTPAAMSNKISLIESSSSPGRSRSSTTVGDGEIASKTHGIKSRSRSLSTIFPPTLRSNSVDVFESTSIVSTQPGQRPRSRTLQPHSHAAETELLHLPKLSKRVSKMTVSEVMLDNLKRYVPEPSEDEVPGIPGRRVVGRNANFRAAAKIREGPTDSIVIRGFPISLCCVLRGSPPLRVTWTKSNQEIRHCDMCNIETTSLMTVLTIAKSELGDSGCYVLQVSNAFGRDKFAVNVRVVDVPAPPGKPIVEEIQGESFRVSWDAPECDGEKIQEYLIEVAEKSSGPFLLWKKLLSTKDNFCVIEKTTAPCQRIFRVSALNSYGFGAPSAVSELEQTPGNLLLSKDQELYLDNLTMKRDQLSSDYDVKEKLAQGQFAAIHKVAYRKTGEKRAAKMMRAIKTRDLDAATREVEILRRLRHQSVVSIIDAYQRDGNVAIVMELLTGEKLLNALSADKVELNEATCAKYVEQICFGLQYIHRHKVAHLDLEPCNVMFADVTLATVKIIGFSNARTLTPRDNSKVTARSVEFAAPEVIAHDVIGCKADVWSLGVISYVMLSGISPFWGGDDNATSSKVIAARWQFECQSFSEISKVAKDFISQLLVNSPKQRPSSNDVLTHDWLKQKANSTKKLNKTNLHNFLARQKRKFPLRAPPVTLPSQQTPPTSQSPDSKLLTSIRTQLKLNKPQTPRTSQPEFIKTFDDVEAMEGSTVRFRCVVNAASESNITWYRDGKVIEESKHFRISSSPDGSSELRIVDVEQTDEAEYSCRARNTSGEVTHCAELIVIGSGL